MTDYYDVNLKKARNKILLSKERYHFYLGFLQDEKILETICLKHSPNIIVHLAAQAGVRYSIENPYSYVESNLVGTFHILEMARKIPLDHLLIASTSSVYGSNIKTPFDETDKSDTPLSFYASTKKSNEVMAHSYSHLFKIPTTIFRFFTVYGPWGRPDMALFKFTKNMLLGNSIDVYNYGNMKRDFTNVEDLVEAIKLLIPKIPSFPLKIKNNNCGDNVSNSAPYRIINIGNSKSVKLLKFIEILEKSLGIKAKINFLDLQDGDIKETFSNIKSLTLLTGFRPKKSLEDGVMEFVNWYKSYYKPKDN